MGGGVVGSAAGKTESLIKCFNNKSNLEYAIIHWFGKIRDMELNNLDAKYTVRMLDI